MTSYSITAHINAPRPVARSGRSNGLLGPILVGAALGAALGASAYLNHRLARKAEHDNLPIGRFIKVGGVRIHYYESGTGAPLVLLHGNGGMIQDFLSSGLLDTAAERHRVIVFDRPGYGYSERPRSRIWTAEAQADLIAAALKQLGAESAIVLGHSWGCSVAVALAHGHPDLVAGLVLEAGYFYPSVRLDVWPMAIPAVPVVGDVLRHTVSPLLSRALWPLLMRRIFGPDAEPPKFGSFPKEMALRPASLRASAEESGLMIPGAMRAQHRYANLAVPVAIVAGAKDRMVSAKSQSARLHNEIPQSTFECVPGTGHMVHQTATEAVLAAVDRIGLEVQMRGPKAGIGSH